MRHFIGIEDDAFLRGKTPMTKQEVRILTLSKARICPQDTVLDIGAGTGSLSIESALLAPEGRIFAIERKTEGVALIRQNADNFSVSNLTVIEGEAPEALENLPRCNVIFIGGSGSRLEEILRRADELLLPQGRMIINCVTVETLHDTLKIMQPREDYTSNAFQVQITRLKSIGEYHMAQALNPISILTYKKN